MAAILILRSSRLIEADQVAAALESHKLPFYRRSDAGGVEQAMPAAPADFPGVFWSIYVPAEVESDARTIIAGLAIDPERDAHWEPSAADNRHWTYFLTVMTIALAVLVYTRCFGH